MSFSNLGAFGFLAGLGLLAGLLFLLARLRVRHREVTVVTTLFWREAVEEARESVLVQRFRHPFAYALTLLIAGLTWLAYAGPESLGEGEGEQIFLLDTSAGMARGDSLAVAKAALVEAVSQAPRARRRVLVCGDFARTALMPGESALLLEKRLEGIEPSASPASFESELLRIAASAASTTSGSTSDRSSALPEVFLVGAARIRPQVLALLPEGMNVRRLDSGQQDGLGNTGITALGSSPAASGRWNVVDVLVEVRGSEPEPKLVVLLDGAQVPLVPESSRSEERTRILLRDVPAEGGVLTVRLEGGDVLALDDEARLRLPDRPLLRVALSPSLRSLERALRADPAVVLDAVNPVIAVRRAGESVGQGLPALEFVPVDSQEDAFLIGHASGDDSHAVLRLALGALGLEEIDATELAGVAGRAISVGADAASVPRVSVWDDLLTSEFNFVQSRSFPLFVARSVRWLAETETALPTVAAGEEFTGRAFAHTLSNASEEGKVLEPVGLSFTAPQVGTWRSESGDSVEVALLDPSATESLGDDSVEASSETRGASFELLTWILLLALALVGLEWFLYRTERMP